MQKCHFCTDRPEGMPRACEEVCPTEAIKSGSINEIAAQQRSSAAALLLKEMQHLFPGSEDSGKD